MFAFKSQKPDAARLYHEKLTNNLNAGFNEGRRFSLGSNKENILRASVLLYLGHLEVFGETPAVPFHVLV